MYIKICKECGDKAACRCIEDGKWYCSNCMRIMNINNMGEKEIYYHFLNRKEITSE